MEDPGHYFRGLDLYALEIDTAYLNITSKSEDNLWLYKRDDDCYLCPWERNSEQGFTKSLITELSTHHKQHLLVLTSGEQEFIRTDSETLGPLTVCKDSIHLGEFGVYDFDVDNCSPITTALKPVNANLAILVCFLVYIGLALVCFALKFVPGKPVHKFERWLGWRAPEQEKPEAKVRQRLRSLDTFRGIALAIMIFVNDGGGHYYFFEHATWNGLYVADLVFPWFLWIMGVCIPMSVKSNLKKNTPLLTVMYQITLRSVKLFCLGFILNTLGGWINVDRLRVPGVLQRFAIAYFVVAIVANLLAKANFCPKGPEKGKLSLFKDILDLAPHWMVMLVILLIHQLIVWLVPAPGCPQGYRGPGGVHDWSPETNNSGCIGGITGYIDKQFFTVSHIYGNPTAKFVYKASAFDPEGLFGSLTTIFQVWLGYQAGYSLQVYSQSKPKIVMHWLAWSTITGGIGCLLCGGTQNEGWLPVNKNLWSLSYVMVTSCFAFALLSLLFVVIDMKNWWKGQPFFYAGMNSILLYCGHSVGYNLFPWHFVIGDMRTHSDKLPEALWGMTLWIFCAFVLYKKNVFVTF